LAAGPRSLDADAALKQAEALEFGDNANAGSAAGDGPAASTGAEPTPVPVKYLDDDVTLIYFGPNRVPYRILKTEVERRNIPPQLRVPEELVESYRKTGVLRRWPIVVEDQ
jgi:hypothetical protein